MSETETSDGRKARQYKTSLTNALAEVIDLMEDARKDGFTAEFSVAQNPDQSYALAYLHIVKRW